MRTEATSSPSLATNSPGASRTVWQWAASRWTRSALSRENCRGGDTGAHGAEGVSEGDGRAAATASQQMAGERMDRSRVWGGKTDREDELADEGRALPERRVVTVLTRARVRRGTAVRVPRWRGREPQLRPQRHLTSQARKGRGHSSLGMPGRTCRNCGNEC